VRGKERVEDVEDEVEEEYDDDDEEEPAPSAAVALSTSVLLPSIKVFGASVKYARDSRP
jgi:hypothetical protein